MAGPVVKVEALSKKFILNHEARESYTTLRDTITRKIRKLSKGKGQDPAHSKEEFWALNNVNFEIQQGERIGIIGRNGAGKSTLLKVLSRITDPSSGRISIRGRVASLLEVGTGFHPELSGRENIFLNGAILGMSRSEIKLKFDEIVAFAEVEKFLDTPVKRYSSGMYVKLAFAVAAHLEPEILIVDEVLAVGDAQFQKKCLGKMQDVSAHGRTVLFVSHQMDAISRLCEKVIYLKSGTVQDFGESQKTINKYLNGEQHISWKRSWSMKDAPGNAEVRLLEVRIISESGDDGESHSIRNSIGVKMTYIVLKDGVRFTHGFNLYGEGGVHILSSHDTEFAKANKLLSRGEFSATAWIPGNFLTEGGYKISVAIMSYDPFMVHFHEYDAVSFSVFDVLDGGGARGLYAGSFPGLIRPLLKWTS